MPNKKQDKTNVDKSVRFTVRFFPNESAIDREILGYFEVEKIKKRAELLKFATYSLILKLRKGVNVSIPFPPNISLSSNISSARENGFSKPTESNNGSHKFSPPKEITPISSDDENEDWEAEFDAKFDSLGEKFRKHAEGK